MSQEELFTIYDPETIFPGADPATKKVIYSSNADEFAEIVEQILMAGAYTKTFDLMKGKIKLTYTTITDSKRKDGFDLMKDFGKNNPDATGTLQDQYTSKVNIALQLIRVEVGNNLINLAQTELKERIQFLNEQSEEVVRLASKYLIVFRNIVNNSFAYEETLKN